MITSGCHGVAAAEYGYAATQISLHRKGFSRVADVGDVEEPGETRLHGGLIREAVRWHQADSGPRTLGLSAYRIDAGERCTVHVHQGKVETWFVMAGRAEVIWGNQTIVVGTGDAVRTPPGTPHGIRVLGDDPVRFLNIVEYIDGAEVTTIEIEDPHVAEPI